MTATERRKQNILEQLVEVEDEHILQQIEYLLNPKVDFWDTLSDKEKESIRRGEKDLDAGRKVPFERFLAEVEAKRSKK